MPHGAATRFPLRLEHPSVLHRCFLAARLSTPSLSHANRPALHSLSLAPRRRSVRRLDRQPAIPTPVDFWCSTSQIRRRVFRALWAVENWKTSAVGFQELEIVDQNDWIEAAAFGHASPIG